MKPTLYYINGNDYRGDEVIDMLKERGGKINAFFSAPTGKDFESIYYIDEDGFIDNCHMNNSQLYNLLKHYGTQLTLPKIKVIKYEDIKKDVGALIKNVQFPQNSQCDSVTAASKIAQVRYQGVDTYGEIVPKGSEAYIIIFDRDSLLSKSNENGGLLRFSTRDQALLFLKNNKILVDIYLKTF